MALLEIRDLSFQADGKKILEGVDLSIADQEIHALIGTNGTGKSTLAFLIMGCEGYTPASGEIVFAGKLLNRLPLHERARLGVTLAWQEPARFEGISVSDYLKVGRQRANPRQHLSQVGLAPEEYLDRMADKTLSGGERKRLELASVLALRPKLAILDEPASGIDMLSMGEIADVIKAFKEWGGSVLLITHQEEIALIADSASQLCGGRIVHSGSAAEVVERYKSRRCSRCDGEECGHDGAR